jgi:hypothetical protein
MTLPGIFIIFTTPTLLVDVLSVFKKETPWPREYSINTSSNISKDIGRYTLILLNRRIKVIKRDHF